MPPGDAGLKTSPREGGRAHVDRAGEGGPADVFAERLGRSGGGRARSCCELDAECATPEFARKREAASRRRDNEQAEYVDEFRQAVLAY